jgi:hypothetical protein
MTCMFSLRKISLYETSHKNIYSENLNMTNLKLIQDESETLSSIGYISKSIMTQTLTFLPKGLWYVS